MAVDSTKLVDIRYGWLRYTHQKTKSLVVGGSLNGKVIASFELANMKAGTMLKNVSGVLKSIKVYGFDSLTSSSGTAPLTADYVANDILVKDNATNTLYKVSAATSGGTTTYSKAVVNPAEYAEGLVAEDYATPSSLMVAYVIDNNADVDNFVQRKF